MRFIKILLSLLIIGGIAIAIANIFSEPSSAYSDVPQVYYPSIKDCDDTGGTCYSVRVKE